MDKASSHDSLNSITSFCHFRSINNYLRIKHYCLDSASDNISTHQLLINDGIAPLIDINKRKGPENPYEAYEILSATGKPICPGGFEMTYWGYEKKRQRSKYRCPLAPNMINQCSCCESCKTTEYGKSVYLKSKDNPRLFGEIQYKSDKWIEI